MPKEDDIGLAARDVTGWRWAERAPQRFKGYEKLAVAGTAIGLANIPDGADSVRLRVETNDVRWLDLAAVTAPTTTDGELLKTTDGVLVLENIGSDGLHALRFIQTSAGATLHANYYRVRA